MSYYNYISPQWENQLALAGLTDFDSWWQFPGEWVEKPNHRRGGWSGVVYSEISLSEHENLGIYIKRQSNHNARNWRHPFSGEPTFKREFTNIMRCRASGINTLEPVFFAVKNRDGEHRAQLATVALSHLKPLDESPCKNDRALLAVIADTLRKLHAVRLQHSSLYPKHLFVGYNHDKLVAHLIDMEKTRKRITSRKASLHDLDTLNRHTLFISQTNKLRFLLEYLQVDYFNEKARKIWRELALRAFTKQQEKAEKLKIKA